VTDWFKQGDLDSLGRWAKRNTAVILMILGFLFTLTMVGGIGWNLGQSALAGEYQEQLRELRDGICPELP